MKSQRVLRAAEVSAKVGLSRRTIYNRLAKGVFPKPISLEGRAVGWLERDVDDWIESKTERSRPLTQAEIDSLWQAFRTKGGDIRHSPHWSSVQNIIPLRLATAWSRYLGAEHELFSALKALGPTQ